MYVLHLQCDIKHLDCRRGRGKELNNRKFDCEQINMDREKTRIVLYTKLGSAFLRAYIHAHIAMCAMCSYMYIKSDGDIIIGTLYSI